MKDPTWPTARELYGLAKAHKWNDFLAAYQAMKKRVRTADRRVQAFQQHTMARELRRREQA